MYRLGRRKRIAILHTIEIGTQFVNLVFYLAPNVYVLLNPCDIFTKNFIYWAGFVRWTCFNTVKTCLPACISVCEPHQALYNGTFSTA